MLRTSPTPSLTQAQVTELTDIFRLLGEPNRLRLVLACLETPQTVGALVDALDLSQTLVSHHLRLLRTAHILRGDRDGRQVRYAIDDAHVRDVVANMIAHLTEPHEHRPRSAGTAATDPPGSKENEMANETKCACADCSCMVDAATAVTKEGKAFCCDACANGHADKTGCDHKGCDCHG